MSEFAALTGGLRATLDAYEATLQKVREEMQSKMKDEAEHPEQEGEAKEEENVSVFMHAGLTDQLSEIRAKAALVTASLADRQHEVSRRGAALGKGTAQLEAEQRSLEEELGALERCHNLPGLESEAELLKRKPDSKALPRSKRLLLRLRHELEKQSALSADVDQAQSKLAEAVVAAGWGPGAPTLSSDARTKVSTANQAGSGVACLQGVSYKPILDSGKVDTGRLSLPLQTVASNLLAARAALINSAAAEQSADKDAFAGLTCQVEVDEGGLKRKAAGDDEAFRGGLRMTVKAQAALSGGAEKDIAVTLRFCHTGHTKELNVELSSSEPSVTQVAGAMVRNLVTRSAPDAAGAEPLWVAQLRGARDGCAELPRAGQLQVSGKKMDPPLSCTPSSVVSAVPTLGPADATIRKLMRRVVHAAAVRTFIDGLKKSGLAGSSELPAVGVKAASYVTGPDAAALCKVDCSNGVTLWVAVPVDFPTRPSHVLPLPAGAAAAATSQPADPLCVSFATETQVPEAHNAAALHANKGLWAAVLREKASQASVRISGPPQPAVALLSRQLHEAAHYAAAGGAPATTAAADAQETLQPDGFFTSVLKWQESGAWDAVRSVRPL
eukprot:TRINITY_DN47653_c0_g1_i1.p1 TRINITY_DN47653_c0_g1~~TRINITY_DN47653_c0_g1_i1.p1  ORF type:complete len:613 (+),score=230.02 TRINITY_DN47653_c0_g1_i1:65-1903(+)